MLSDEVCGRALARAVAESRGKTKSDNMMIERVNWRRKVSQREDDAKPIFCYPESGGAVEKVWFERGKEIAEITKKSILIFP